MKFDRTTPWASGRLTYNLYLGNDLYLYKNFAEGFSADRNSIVPIPFGGGGVVLGLPQENKGNLPETGADVGCRWIVRNLLVLSAGKHRAYIYHGVQCGGHSLRCALSDGYPHPLVFAGRRKTAAPFLFRFSGGDRGNLPDQFQWSPVGLGIPRGIGWPCWRLLFGPAILF